MYARWLLDNVSIVMLDGREVVGERERGRGVKNIALSTPLIV
jgi:hypothetical protein